MPKNLPHLSAKFVKTHFVDEKYHEHHPQLIHCHKDVLELFYVIKGCGNYVVGDRKYFVEPGSLVICNAGVLHGEPPFQQHVMQSYCGVLRDVSVPNLPPNNLIDNMQKPVLFFSSDKAPIEHILLALHELDSPTSAAYEICDLLANALLNVVYLKMQKRQLSNEWIRENNEELIQQIITYLNEHYMEPLSLQHLGDVFHMSYYHLSHIFKANTGLSPIKYVLHRKIGEAQNLLMNTNMQIGEIGEDLGFNDNCHFSSIFKKRIGVSPLQYRQHFQQ
jgi:AraC-like DNA-binding protein